MSYLLPILQKAHQCQEEINVAAHGVVDGKYCQKIESFLISLIMNFLILNFFFKKPVFWIKFSSFL